MVSVSLIKRPFLFIQEKIHTSQSNIPLIALFITVNLFDFIVSVMIHCIASKRAKMCFVHVLVFGSFMFLFCLVFAMFCARLFICALWSPAGKGLTSWLSFVVSSVSLSLSH